jgi:benzoate-CoA ligase
MTNDREHETANAGGFNAAVALIAANLPAHAHKVAVIDDDGPHTYAEIAERADRCGAALLAQGSVPGDRVILCLQDSVDFTACFLGAIKAGLIPIPLNTLLPPDDYAYILGDSTARLAVVSQPLLERFEAGVAQANWTGPLIVQGGENDQLAQLAAEAALPLTPVMSAPDAPAFWLYSSGSTGRPKGAVHRHASLGHTAELFGRQVLGLTEDDVIYSASKLFFAYGLGNGLTFPMSVGATVVLTAGRATPEVVWGLLERYKVSVFCGVPTLYAGMLAKDAMPPALPSSVRMGVSAGEALPQDVGRRWTTAMGCEIVDGVGSTEMLHVFLTNRPGVGRYGSLAGSTPGYALKLLSEDGQPVAQGDIGELYVRGPSAAIGYWNRPDKTAQTFVGGWVRTGDQLRQDETGAYVFAGRTDDMLKVGGVWVSPAEVEAALIEHPAVLEAAVVGAPDANALIKIKAFVVLATGAVGDAEALRDFAKTRLAPYKCPRAIAFVDELPKTATGKIRRHVLRDAEKGVGE